MGKKAKHYINSKKVADPNDCGFSAPEVVEFLEKRDPNSVWDFSMLEIPALDRIAQRKGIKTVARNERLAFRDSDCRGSADASRPQSADSETPESVTPWIPLRELAALNRRLNDLSEGKRPLK